MIHLLPGKKVEFVRFNYPEKSTFHINVERKKAYIHNGVLLAAYDFDKINKPFILLSFGSVIGGEIIRLCGALANGENLTLELLGSLEIKGNEECDEQFTDVSLPDLYCFA